MLYQAQIIKIISLTACLSLLAGLSGCSTWLTAGLQDPQIQLVEVEVIEAKLLEQQFVLHFRLDNPNSVNLPVHNLSYSVQLNGIQLAAGESSQHFSVPAHSHHVFEVPVRTNLWRHVRLIARALEEPDQPIRYSFHGSVKTGLLFCRSVHLSRNGEIIPGDYIPE